jgi:hypothetical protein
MESFRLADIPVTGFDHGTRGHECVTAAAALPAAPYVPVTFT